jgi:hypothetical protein
VAQDRTLPSSFFVVAILFITIIMIQHNLLEVILMISSSNQALR